MTPGETLIIILLIFIAYFLYQIAKQLSHLTGVRIKFPFLDNNLSRYKKFILREPTPARKKEHLPN